MAESCPSRWVAEYQERADSGPKEAADLGTAVHAALEHYVQGVYVDKKHEPDRQMLLDLYRMNFLMLFGESGDTHEMYDDGIEMLKKWYERTSFENVEVLSCEKKDTFPLQTSAGDIPFNYIWDRFDRLTDQDETYRVVDYKTIRANVSGDELGRKIQARVYGLIAQIKYPNAKRIWVQFDLLRHTSVGRVFTRDENIATWRMLQGVAEKIISWDEATIPVEVINADCRYCVRKASCKTLLKNQLVGGIIGMETSQMVDTHALISWQLSALTDAKKQLESALINLAEEDQLTELQGNVATATLGVTRGQREIDPQRVRDIVGAALFDKYGGINLTIGQFDKLLKDPELPDDCGNLLRNLVTKSTGNLKIIPKPKNALD